MRLISLLLLCLSTAASAGDALEQIAGVQLRQRSRSFEGVVVTMQDGRFEAMRVVHRAGGEGFEQVISLSGVPRGLRSSPDEIRIDLAGVSQRLSAMPVLPVTLDAHQIDRSYKVGVSGQDRIAGFPAQVIDAVARDGSRYSQRLWLDGENGVLLGVALIGPERQVLSQVMFTSLTVSPAVSADRAAVVAAAPLPDLGLQAIAPAGFVVISDQAEGARRRVLYCDGLANLTLYLEKRATPADRLTTLRRGATQLAARQRGLDRAIAVGEVPLVTATELADRAILWIAQ